MDLMHIRRLRNNRRNDRLLKWPGGDNHAFSLDRPRRSLNPESGTPRIALYGRNLDTAANRG